MPLASPKCFTSRYKVRLSKSLRRISPGMWRQILSHKPQRVRLLPAMLLFIPQCGVDLTSASWRSACGGGPGGNRAGKSLAGASKNPKRQAFTASPHGVENSNFDADTRWRRSGSLDAFCDGLRGFCQPTDPPIDRISTSETSDRPPLMSALTSIARVLRGVSTSENTRDAIATFAVSGQPVGRWKNSELVVKRPRIG